MNKLLKLARKADDVSKILSTKKGESAKKYKDLVDKVAKEAQDFALDVGDTHFDIMKESLVPTLKVVEMRKIASEQMLGFLEADVQRAQNLSKGSKRIRRALTMANGGQPDAI